MNPVFALTVAEVFVILSIILRKQDSLPKLHSIRYTLIGFGAADTLLALAWLISLQARDFNLRWLILAASINGALALINLSADKLHHRLRGR